MSHRGAAKFCATTGTLQGFGANPQEALAALMRRSPGDAPAPIVIWPYNRGDASVEGGAAGPVAGAERPAESSDRRGAVAGGLSEVNDPRLKSGACP
jgi:hypothetical protein